VVAARATALGPGEFAAISAILPAGAIAKGSGEAFGIVATVAGLGGGRHGVVSPVVVRATARVGCVIVDRQYACKG